MATHGPMSEDPDLLRDAAGVRHAPADEHARIVSLVPSLTELLCDLGLASRLVGRTRFCCHPREVVRQIPVVGGTKDVDIEKVRAIAPTHVIVNVDENRREQVDELARFVPHVIVTHPLGPEDNLGLFRLFGAIFGGAERARVLAEAFEAARAELHAATAHLPRQRVLYLIWKDPWMTVARETYISAALAAAGWDTVPEHSTERYPIVGPELTRAVSTDRVLLATEPYRFTRRHVPEAEACFGKPACLVDGQLVSWYGSRAAAGLRYLARVRHACASRPS